MGREAGLEVWWGTVLAAGVWAGWQHGSSGKTRPPARPAGFCQLVPIARAQLIAPKLVQNPQLTTALACGFLPYLWLSVGVQKEGSEAKNTPGSTDALFL